MKTYQVNVGSIQLFPNKALEEANINFIDHPVSSQISAQQDPNERKQCISISYQQKRGKSFFQT